LRKDGKGKTEQRALTKKRGFKKKKKACPGFQKKKRGGKTGGVRNPWGGQKTGGSPYVQAEERGKTCNDGRNTAEVVFAVRGQREK